MPAPVLSTFISVYSLRMGWPPKPVGPEKRNHPECEIEPGAFWWADECTKHYTTTAPSTNTRYTYSQIETFFLYFSYQHITPYHLIPHISSHSLFCKLFHLCFVYSLSIHSFLFCSLRYALYVIFFSICLWKNVFKIFRNSNSVHTR